PPPAGRRRQRLRGDRRPAGADPAGLRRARPVVPLRVAGARPAGGSPAAQGPAAVGDCRATSATGTAAATAPAAAGRIPVALRATSRPRHGGPARWPEAIRRWRGWYRHPAGENRAGPEGCPATG